MVRNFLHDIYPFARLSSSSFNNFTWIVWLLGVGTYIVIGASFIWAPACYLLLREIRLERIGNHLEKRLWRCLLAGIGAIAVLYALDSTFSLMASPGRVLSVVVSALFWVMLVVGYAGIALWINFKAGRKQASLVSIAVGAGLITILQVIPLVGPLFIAWFVLLALGSVVVSVSTGDQTALRSATSPDSRGSQPPAGTEL
jgi:hypothetical protein